MSTISLIQRKTQRAKMPKLLCATRVQPVGVGIIHMRISNASPVKDKIILTKLPASSIFNLDRINLNGKAI